MGTRRKRRRCEIVVLWAGILLGLGVTSLALEETEELPLTQAEITYLTAETVYISAGRNQGLEQGDIIEVLRASEIIATLQVTGISSRRASTRRLSGELPLAIGDLVRFVPRQRKAASIDLAPIAEHLDKSRPGRSWRSLRQWGLRGRVGLRYLAVKDRSGRANNFNQPALDLKLSGVNLGGSGIALTIDMRTRRTYRRHGDGSSESESHQRLYRFAASWGLKRVPLRFTVGRQYAPAFANVSVFDGILAQWNREKWSVGVFSGLQPGALDFRFASDVHEHGVYFQRRGGSASTTRWSVTTGAVGSYERGEINREFLFLQGRYFVDRFSAYLIQEIDYNRGWRKAAEGSNFSRTSSYLSLRYRISEQLMLNAGYDNRRHLRTFRDFETPETEFDDRFRQGIWGGVSWRFLGRFRLGLNSRMNRGGGAGDSEAFTLTFSARRLTPLRLSVRTRSTSYSNPRNEGWLHSASIGAQLTHRLHLAFGGGIRSEASIASAFGSNDVVWYGFDLDLNLSRRWYWLGSFERTDSDDEGNDQIYTSLVYRF